MPKLCIAALKEAVVWYASNLNKDDIKTYGKPSQVSLISDLNVLTPGLQVVHLEKLDKYSDLHGWRQDL